MLEQGIFALTFDTELAWGFIDNPRKIKNNYDYYLKSRDVTDAILRLLEKYEIKATWAVVGHLFLNSCSKSGGIKHPDIIRSTPGKTNDVFDCDPCSDLEREPIWYGADIIKKIIDCTCKQEIGCHTFSHTVVGMNGCDESCFNSELRLCKKIANHDNISLTSFVFPKNVEAHHNILVNNDFLVYRGRERAWYGFLPFFIQRFGWMIDSLLPMVSPPVDSPTKQLLWNVPGSYFLGHCSGIAKYIPLSFRVSKCKRGLMRACQENKIFHLWLHPFNVASSPDKMLAALESIFIEFRRLNKNNLITNYSMSEIALLAEGIKND